MKSQNLLLFRVLSTYYCANSVDEMSSFPAVPNFTVGAVVTAAERMLLRWPAVPTATIPYF